MKRRIDWLAQHERIRADKQRHDELERLYRQRVSWRVQDNWMAHVEAMKAKIQAESEK